MIETKVTKSTRTLPASHALAGTIDLSKDRWALFLLNAAGLVLFLGSGWLLIRLAASTRPDIASRVFTITAGSFIDLLGPLAWMIGITLVTLVIHEAIHGLFFWIFTGSRPRFGFRGLFAFAAAPDWYIPRRYYWIVVLAPVLFITIGGIGAVLVVSDNLLPPLLFLISMNFAGSVGDMFVALWLTRKKGNILAQDYGSGVRIYQPIESSGLVSPKWRM
jgi:hypothetical protein